MSYRAIARFAMVVFALALGLVYNALAVEVVLWEDDFEGALTKVWQTITLGPTNTAIGR